MMARGVRIRLSPDPVGHLGAVLASNCWDYGRLVTGTEDTLRPVVGSLTDLTKARSGSALKPCRVMSVPVARRVKTVNAR